MKAIFCPNSTTTSRGVSKEKFLESETLLFQGNDKKEVMKFGETYQDRKIGQVGLIRTSPQFEQKRRMLKG